ncbi:MAG TPA: hypothetical protein VFQ23_04165 [Anaerolineales bacterium]|nr:hypothetical protein [Anaerolineales bacterium]
MPTSTAVKRIMFALLIGLLGGVLISEIPFLFLQETARPPQEILLTIPAGAAEQVARGEQPPSIPNNMSFVVGDVLVVENEDNVDHKLGSLWIPANSSARLPFNREESLAFECTFQSDNYLGLDVHQPLTFGTRIYGIISVGLPLAILVALYSLVMPISKKENAVA